MGFGATASGTYSIVMAPNTGALIIQKHAGYGFADLASVAQTWQANHWYRLEVDWQVGGTIIGRLYDSDGVTLLNTVIASDNTIKSGGIAFRAFDGNTLFDTVQRVVAAGASSRSQSTIQQSTVVDAAILALVPPPFADSQSAADKDGLAVLNTRQAGTSPAMLPPTPSAASGLSEPGLKKNRAALVDLAITGLEEDLLENWLIDDLAALP